MGLSCSPISQQTVTDAISGAVFTFSVLPSMSFQAVHESCSQCCLQKTQDCSPFFEAQLERGLYKIIYWYIILYPITRNISMEKPIEWPTMSHPHPIHMEVSHKKSYLKPLVFPLYGSFLKWGVPPNHPFMGFSVVNHPFLGISIYIYIYRYPYVGIQ